MVTDRALSSFVSGDMFGTLTPRERRPSRRDKAANRRKIMSPCPVGKRLDCFQPVKEDVADFQVTIRSLRCLWSAAEI